MCASAWLAASESPPVWAPIQDRHDRIVANPTEHHLREELIEDLKQVLLRFYPSRDWGQLCGEERRQRRRAIQLLFGTTLLFLTLALYANHERLVALSRELTAKAETLAATAF